MKICRSCNTAFPLEHYRRKDGTSIGKKCRKCLYEKTRQWLASDIGKERTEVYRMASYRKASSQNWKANNKDKTRVHNIVAGYIRKGLLVRQSCEVCGNAKSHAHHTDYSKPLEIAWLCHEHHRKVHADSFK